ncbi:MAG: 50S ribosomal protein L34, partial [Lachnospiraceae bacterium]|nr:50S ribosomal protein L34 [Lachnospiraceae bacterium]
KVLAARRAKGRHKLSA